MRGTLHTTLLIIFLITLSACGNKKPYDLIPEPPDHEPDSDIESYAFEDDVPEEQIDKYKEFIIDLGGKYNDPTNYEDGFEGLNNYLEDSGVTHFSAEEIATPGTPEAAERCGIENLIPKKGNWVKAVAITLIYEDVRRVIESPIQATSWFRPECYNRLVGGAKRSDHIGADAMDVVYKSKALMKVAKEFLCEMYWIPNEGALVYDWDLLNIAFGLGGDKMHISLFSDKGRRYWFYPTYVNDDNDNLCWPRNKQLIL